MLSDIELAERKELFGVFQDRPGLSDQDRDKGGGRDDDRPGSRAREEAEGAIARPGLRDRDGRRRCFTSRGFLHSANSMASSFWFTSFVNHSGNGA